MHNRNLPGRGRPGRRATGPLVALGTAAAAAVLVVGYVLTSAGPQRAVSSADVAGSVPWTGAGTAGAAGGWGQGGYPMMPGTGPARSAGSSSVAQNAPDGATAAVTDVASENWAGYAATGAGGSFTAVSASWAQPGLDCGTASAFSAFWAGLDGDGTPTVEQTGTEADCANGVASYQGWYEIFPNAPVFYADPVQPGDAMSASVASDGNGEFTLTLSDATQGWTQTTQQSSANAQLGSAEVIAEAPSDGTVLPLADFGTVNFTNATVDNAPIGNNADLSELTMQSAQGADLATPSALTGGNAFTVTWDGAAPTGPGASPSASPAPTAPSAPPGGRRHHHHHHRGRGF
jgi:hypothetical protein